MKRRGYIGTRAAHGFSLVEVMVAVVVICIGLLGIAKMQSLALSSTNMARMRSLAALEAASLAAAMHANRGYWAGANPTNTPPPVTITYIPTNTPPVQGVGTTAPASCTQCTPTQLAAYDLNTWTNSLQGLLPGATATISCPAGAPPVNCTITITWTENPVAMTQQEATQSAAIPIAGFNNPTYTLDVEP